jgi:hypothetical protein
VPASAPERFAGPDLSALKEKLKVLCADYRMTAAAHRDVERARIAAREPADPFHDERRR